MTVETIMCLTDKELLKEYQRVAKMLLDSKDEELCFLGDHPNRDFWSDEMDEEYSELLEKISDLQKEFDSLNEIVSER